MVRVRALRRCFYDNIMRPVGTEFEYDGEITEGMVVAVDELGETKLPKQSAASKAAAAKAAALAATSAAKSSQKEADDAVAADKKAAKK